MFGPFYLGFHKRECRACVLHQSCDQNSTKPDYFLSFHLLGFALTIHIRSVSSHDEDPGEELELKSSLSFFCLGAKQLRLGPSVERQEPNLAHVNLKVEISAFKILNAS